MSHTATARTSSKSAYQRPYKSRRQRRETDRRQHSEASDYQFLRRAVVVVGLVLVLALVCVVKGMAE